MGWCFSILENKGGNTYIVEAETAKEAKTVIPLVTDSSNAFEENFFDFFECDDDFESEFLKSQKSMTQKDGKLFMLTKLFVKANRLTIGT